MPGRPETGQRPGHDNRGAKEGTGDDLNPTSTLDQAGEVEHFRRRVLVDALAEGMRATWERRAAAFEAARPKSYDYTGAATADEIRATDRRLTGAAAACRHKASIMPTYVLDVAALLEEVA